MIGIIINGINLTDEEIDKEHHELSELAILDGHPPLSREEVIVRWVSSIIKRQSDMERDVIVIREIT